MHLTPEDVKRLYGARLYLLPEDQAALPADSPAAETTQAPSVEPTPPDSPAVPDPQRFLAGSAIDWKMKPNANLALVLTQAEFDTRELTALLKQAVLNAGVNVARIGFGIYEAEAESWDFGSMPVEVAVICGGCAGQLPEALQAQGKYLLPAPALAEVSRSPGQQAQLEVVLRQAQARL